MYLLIYAEEWLDGIIIRSDYINMQLLCLTLPIMALCLILFSAYYAKNFMLAYLTQAYLYARKSICGHVHVDIVDIVAIYM